MPHDSLHFSLGLIGLGVMGSHVARNFAHKKIPIAVFNRTQSITQEFIENYSNEYIQSAATLEELVQKLEKTRILLLMVQAGPAIDEVIDSLLFILEPGDMIVDLGNSFYHDTERRAERCKTKGILFGGCGISGGEKGALEGPSLMLGGSPELRSCLKPLLEPIAAKDFAGGPCVTYCGPGGSGHYVKMVHNGIEYGLMQCIAEVYELLEKAGHTPDAIAGILIQWQKGQLASFLIELAAQVVKTKDSDATLNSDDTFLIQKILDKAEQKGTGTWTAKEALDRGVPTPTITAAVMARAFSSFWQVRQELAKNNEKFAESQRANLSPLQQKEGIESLEQALLGAFMSTFIQGLELLKTASVELAWGLDLKEVVRVWQGGCIIRSELLKVLTEALTNGSTIAGQQPHLLALPEIRELLDRTLPHLQKTVQTGIHESLPFVGMSSSLAYVQAFRQGRGNSYIIQALRDAFGAHTYQRVDKPGNFHTIW